MKLTRAIEEEVITSIAGEDVLELVSYIKEKTNISEFVIAEDLEKEINTTRNMLYRLLHANLVSFTRKKDKQKGWYIYYWTYSEGNILHLYWESKKIRLEDLKLRLLREETTVFFSCPEGCIRLDFDKAIEFDYLCPECGELLMQQDSSAKTKEMKKEIKELETLVLQKPKTVLSFSARADARRGIKAPVVDENAPKQKFTKTVKEIASGGATKKKTVKKTTVKKAIKKKTVKKTTVKKATKKK